MDKNTYETYEFLPVDSANSSEQFFVVPDDGTFLLNRQVQFVTEESSKDPLDCRVYDISAQQFYNVDNSSELISVPDDFSLQTEEGSYDSYLIQATPQEPDLLQQKVEIENSQIAQVENVDFIIDTQKPTLTEITLSDEQYNILEEKGWILLQNNDKIYVLDSLGLHDVTGNSKLLENCKDEIDGEEDKILQIKTPNEELLESQQTEAPLAVDAANTTHLKENSLAEPKYENDDQNNMVVDVDGVESNLEDGDSMQIDMGLITDPISKPANILDKGPVVPKIRRTLKVKTKLKFTDIPKHIVIGETVNGKKLVAKLVKHVKKMAVNNKPTCKSVTKNKRTNVDLSNQVVVNVEAENNLSEEQLRLLIQKCLSAKNRDFQCDANTLHTLKALIQKTLETPEFNPSDYDSKCLVTMVSRMTVDPIKQTMRENLPVLVTGKLIQTDGKWDFNHQSSLLYELVENATAETKPAAEKNKENFLHIHIVETRSINNEIVISINISTRNIVLPSKESTETDANSRRSTHSKSIHTYACGACAMVYPTEAKLTEHQAISHCTKVTEPEKKEVANVKKSILKSKVEDQSLKSNEKTAAIHPKASINIDTEDTASGKIEIYRCKMCPLIFYHSSTLLKHILKVHIKASN